MTTEAIELLPKIQAELKAPKNLHNKFGDYDYRSAESILEALKPILAKYHASIIVIDEAPFQVGDKTYLPAVATITFQDASVAIGRSQAAEPDSKKGMDLAQLTGATSSYARKYALNGLLAIDDSQDNDMLQPAQPIGEGQIKDLYALLEELTEEQNEIFQVWMYDQTGAGCVEELTLDNVGKVHSALKAKIKAMKAELEQ